MKKMKQMKQLSWPEPENFLPEPAAHCSCRLEPGYWGSSGWHFYKHDISGTWTAYERCPHYWSAVKKEVGGGRVLRYTVDFTDRRKLIVSGGSKGRKVDEKALAG